MDGATRPGRGQAEAISVVLLIAITVAGTMTIVVLGSVALDENKQTSATQGTEHSMTQLDSRAAIVALGGSNSQEVNLGRSDDGSYVVRDESGWVNITHINQSGSGDVETIYNESLGAIVYENGDVEIAYQGGGVWRKEGNGSTMISPPEFHYQSATLTFPIIRVHGADSASGRVVAEITEDGDTRRIYPNASSTYAASGDTYANPIRDGNVTVTIHSEYYHAWEEYFETRTDGEVTVYHTNDTVEVKLLSVGSVGDFGMPADGNTIDVNGLDEDSHSITNFTIILYPDDTDSANFANLQWSLYDDQGGQEIEIHLRDSGSNNNGSTACTERDVSATVYYSDKNGDPYHGWYNDTAFRTECYDRDDDGTDDETRLVANLTGDTRLTMQDLSSSELNHFNPGSATRNTSVTFDEHSSSVDWESETFTDGGDDDTTIGNLTGHYLALMGPNVNLVVDDKNSDTINEEASEGTLELTGRGQFLTFLHVTENGIRVEFE